MPHGVRCRRETRNGSSEEYSSRRCCQLLACGPRLRSGVQVPRQVFPNVVAFGTNKRRPTIRRSRFSRIRDIFDAAPASTADHGELRVLSRLRFADAGAVHPVVSHVREPDEIRLRTGGGASTPVGRHWGELSAAIVVGAGGTAAVHHDYCHRRLAEVQLHQQSAGDQTGAVPCVPAICRRRSEDLPRHGQQTAAR